LIEKYDGFDSSRKKAESMVTEAVAGLSIFQNEKGFKLYNDRDGKNLPEGYFSHVSSNLPVHTHLLSL
jgi:hypothetical protein